AELGAATGAELSVARRRGPAPGPARRRAQAAMPSEATRAPLIAVAAWLPASGFTRVLWTLLHGLAARYDVHYIGIGYRGPSLHEAGVTLHPSNLQGGDVFGAYQCAAMVQE